MNSWNNITLFCFDCCANTVSGDLDFADHCWHVHPAQGGVLILGFLVRIIAILTKLLYPKTKIFDSGGVSCNYLCDVGVCKELERFLIPSLSEKQDLLQPLVLGYFDSAAIPSQLRRCVG